MSSSSDDDWMIPKSKPPGGTGAGGGGESAMMAARRAALQRKREEQQQQVHQTQYASSVSSSASVRRPPTSGRLGSGGSSDQQPHASGLDSTMTQPPSNHELQLAEAAAAAAAASEALSVAPAAAALVAPVVENTVESLKRQVEARRKLLQATRERELVMGEKWRAEKAQKRAEIHQLEARLRTVWGSLEDEKSSAEGLARQRQDAQETEMRAARTAVEKEVKAEYLPQVERLQALLVEKRAEEERLRTLLSGESATQDAVRAAVASALTTIMGRIQEVFTQNAGDTQEWTSQVHELIRHEVRSSFAVSAGSEAQAEREAHTRHFEDLLEFWREAEQQEQQRIAQIDETLLADAQSMAQEDMERLHREELAMEEVYVTSREAWAAVHERTLKAELDTSLQRRQVELEEQRAARHELHVARVKEIEERHKAQMVAEEQLHAREMAQLREHFAREERLQAERHRIALAARDDVALATNSVQEVLASVEGVVASLKEYQGVVDKGRVALDADRVAALECHEKALGEIQSLVSAQCVSLDEEHAHLGDTVARLQVVSQQVGQQLQEEADWLAQQEAQYERSRETWEREYRAWRALSQREQQAARDRFHAALASLQGSLALLDKEERDMRVEASAISGAFADITSATTKEIASLQSKDEVLEARSTAMQKVLKDMEEASKQTTHRWRALQLERSQLAQAREELRSDASKLQNMMQALKLVRTQMEGMRTQTAVATERGRALAQQLDRLKASDGTGFTQQQHQEQYVKAMMAAAAAMSGKTDHTRAAPRDQSRRELGASGEASRQTKRGPRAMKHTDRLPLKVLGELQEQLRSFDAGLHSLGVSQAQLSRLDTGLRQQKRQRVVGKANTYLKTGIASGEAGDASLSPTAAAPAAHSQQPIQGERMRSRHSSPTALADQGRGTTTATHTPVQRPRYADPSPQFFSSQTRTDTSVSQMGEWSPSGNTFTNLVHFSDNDTTT